MLNVWYKNKAASQSAGFARRWSGSLHLDRERWVTRWPGLVGFDRERRIPRRPGLIDLERKVLVGQIRKAVKAFLDRLGSQDFQSELPVFCGECMIDSLVALLLGRFGGRCGNRDERN